MKTLPKFGDKVHFLELNEEDYTHRPLPPIIYNCVVEEVLVKIRGEQGESYTLSLDTIKKGWKK